MLPFGPDQFFGVFRAYNLAVWPAQPIAYLFAVLALALIGRAQRFGSQAIVSILALGWAWTGLVYHGLFFAEINPAARIFAAGFLLEAVLLLEAGVLRNALAFTWSRTGRTVAAAGLVVYATLLYPLLGSWTGHGYPDAPSFGITPCPLTIFTFGLLLLAPQPLPRRVLIVPILWSLVGGSAAILLDVPQDWMLLPGAAAGVWLLAKRSTGEARRA